MKKLILIILSLLLLIGSVSAWSFPFALTSDQQAVVNVCNSMTEGGCQWFDYSVCSSDDSGFYSCQDGGAYGPDGIYYEYYCSGNDVASFVKCADGETCLNGLCGGQRYQCTPFFEVCSDGSDFNTPASTGDVYECDINGHWSLKDVCSSGESCVESSAIRSDCVSDTQYYCRSQDRCFQSNIKGGSCYDTLSACQDSVIVWCYNSFNNACYKRSGSCNADEFEFYDSNGDIAMREACESRIDTDKPVGYTEPEDFNLLKFIFNSVNLILMGLLFLSLLPPLKKYRIYVWFIIIGYLVFSFFFSVGLLFNLFY